MPRIIDIEPVVPGYEIDQKTARKVARHLFSHAPLDIERLLPIFENTCIEKRYSCVPLEWFTISHSFHEKNQLYLKNALDLCRKAVAAIIDRVNLPARNIAHIFFVSTTGIATPSLDAHLFNIFDFSPSIRRTPIWGLGCAGGISGIARAVDWLKAYPRQVALVVAVELCTLTFIRSDFSKSNFIATSLFGDGAGAVLLGGDDCPLTTDRMISVVSSDAITWKKSLEVMGWEVNDSGLKVLFSRDIPTIVHNSAKPTILEFLAKNDLRLEDISAFLSHPGGAKVINAYQDALALSSEKTKYMWEVLRQFGNMSSATVLFVLDRFMKSSDYNSGQKLLSCSLGPGFSSEMILGVCA
ncbi:MAG: type III polyketide synthase [candidate division KSB1 bacterium]|nr:type III polyketide synthase [candidate division KSB1 bacterium]